MDQRGKRAVVGTAVAAGLVAVGLGALWAFTPDPRRPRAEEGRALLRLPDGPFADRQVGLRFTPPGDWALQVVSIESPRVQKPERTLVKYKRVVPDVPVAWFKVSVVNDPAGRSPEELVRTRKPPEPGWKVVQEVEADVTVGGRPAARITFGGELEPDGTARAPFTCEVVAVRRGPRALFLAGTFPTNDAAARQAVRAAVASAALDPD
jgi:hypothetical protein